MTGSDQSGSLDGSLPYDAFGSVLGVPGADADFGPLDPHSIEEMQRLAQEYAPDIHGPLVGDLKSCTALALEYSTADPAYIRKTASLSAKYDSYRAVIGDGNCGWRALAFGYFECLAKTQDHTRLGMEFARIMSLNGLMVEAGFEPFVFEDFADATFDVFRALLKINYTDGSFLLKTFNNPEICNAIVTHFKLLTSAWLKTSRLVYQGFLEQPLALHCETHIEPYGVEIDHMGLMGFIDCLVLPASMAVEIIYLDRSPGEEVNIHRFEKREGRDNMPLTPSDAPAIRLLYRPGHYDIVYKLEELAAASPVEPYIPCIHECYQVSFLSTSPELLFQPTPISQQQYSEYLPPDDASFCEDSNQDSNQDLPAPCHTPSDDSSIFRQSMLSIPEFQPCAFQPLPFASTTFRNSPFNPSHFQNENFQPEIYQPPGPPHRSYQQFESTHESDQYL